MSKISPLQQAGGNLVAAVIHHQVLVRLFAATEDVSIMTELRVSARNLALIRGAFHDRMVVAASTNETTLLRFFGGNVIAAEYSTMSAVATSIEVTFPLAGMFRYMLSDGWGESPRSTLEKMQIQALHTSVTNLQQFKTEGKNVLPDFEPASQVWDEVLAPINYDEALTKAISAISSNIHGNPHDNLSLHGF